MSSHSYRDALDKLPWLLAAGILLLLLNSAMADDQPKELRSEREILATLGRMQDMLHWNRPMLEVTLGWLEDKRPAVQIAAVEALGFYRYRNVRRQDKRVAKSLIELYHRSEDFPGVRTSIAATLLKLPYTTLPGSPLPSETNKLINAMLVDKAPSVRELGAAHAKRAHGRVPGSFPRLVENLRDQNDGVAWLAAEAIACYADQSEQLDQDQPKVLREAVLRLGNMLFYEEKRDGREAAAQGLHVAQKSSMAKLAIDDLIDALKIEEDEATRARAVSALGSMFGDADESQQAAILERFNTTFSGISPEEVVQAADAIAEHIAPMAKHYEQPKLKEKRDRLVATMKLFVTSLPEDVDPPWAGPRAKTVRALAKLGH